MYHAEKNSVSASYHTIPLILYVQYFLFADYVQSFFDFISTVNSLSVLGKFHQGGNCNSILSMDIKNHTTHLQGLLCIALVDRVSLSTMAESSLPRDRNDNMSES
jgi:hypothetical protein